MAEKILLIGAGGHAKTVVDTIEKQKNYEIAGFIEQDGHIDKCYRGYPVIGTDKELEKLYQTGICNAAITIGYLGKSDIREKIYYILKKIGYKIPVIIDDTAIIANDVLIGEGTYVGRNAVVNADAELGKMCIINTAAIIEHDCRVGDFTHVAVGAVLCGGVMTGKGCLIGANATVLQTIMIENYSIVGAGKMIAGTVNKKIPLKRNEYGGGITSEENVVIWNCRFMQTRTFLRGRVYG